MAEAAGAERGEGGQVQAGVARYCSPRQILHGHQDMAWATGHRSRWAEANAWWLVYLLVVEAEEALGKSVGWGLGQASGGLAWRRLRIRQPLVTAP